MPPYISNLLLYFSRWKTLLEGNYFILFYFVFSCVWCFRINGLTKKLSLINEKILLKIYLIFYKLFSSKIFFKTIISHVA